MPEPLRDLLIAARAATAENIARLDSELQRLAGQTPEERAAWMRRMNRATKTLAVAGIAAAAAWTWLRHHPLPVRPVVVGAAAGVAAALIVWSLLPDTGPYPPPPDRTAPTPAMPTPTPTPGVEPTGTPPTAPTPPADQPTPGDGPTTSTPPPGRPPPGRPPPEPTTPPNEDVRERCLRLRPTIVIRPGVCLDRAGELLPVDLAPGAFVTVPPRRVEPLRVERRPA